MLRSVTAKAPASTMLFGEHSILRKGRAVVAAIDCWVSVNISTRTDDRIEIFSCLGNTSTSIHKIQVGPSFRFIQSALERFSPDCGMTIKISSDIDPTLGLGSSASVTVASLLALATLFEQNWDQAKLLHESIQLIHTVQGHGSGADAASIIYGGVIAFHPLQVEPLRPSLPITLLYSGTKTPTPEVISFVTEQEKAFPLVFDHLFAAIDQTTEVAIKALIRDDFPLCGKMMNRADALMQALGVGTADLSDLCWKLRYAPTIYGAKISGSGLGDSVVGLGTFPSSIPSTVTAKGAYVL